MTHHFDNLFIVTGAPGAGKTTLLEAAAEAASASAAKRRAPSSRRRRPSTVRRITGAIERSMPN